jgi:hypothetical protein
MNTEDLMKKTLISLLVVATVAFSSISYAKGDGGTFLGLTLDLGNSKVTQKVNNGTTSETTTESLAYDIQSGYVFPMGLYLGLVYEASSTSVKTPTESKTTDGGTGVSLGYRRGGFLLDAHYFLSFENKSGTSSWSKGSGIGVDIGYMYNLSGGFYLGTKLAYRSIEMTELKVSNTTTPNSNLKYNTLSPQIFLAFMF